MCHHAAGERCFGLTLKGVVPRFRNSNHTIALPAPWRGHVVLRGAGVSETLRPRLFHKRTAVVDTEIVKTTVYKSRRLRLLGRTRLIRAWGNSLVDQHTLLYRTGVLPSACPRWRRLTGERHGKRQVSHGFLPSHDRFLHFLRRMVYGWTPRCRGKCSKVGSHEQ